MTRRKAYKLAGVDVDAGNRAAGLYLRHIRSTKIKGVLDLPGGFAGLFELGGRYKNPVLVSGTDGVGTKLRIAFDMNRHDTVGEDLVAMCVNDVVVQGARPLFFLDYAATGRVRPEKMANIVKGVASGCRKAGCALVGGETAEMPGFYADDEYDLAGFAVGVVEKKRLITGKSARPGDLVIGLSSSGLHSNGFSLARKVLLEKKYTVKSRIAGLGRRTLGEVLLTPTIIYAKIVVGLLERYHSDVRSICHVTGGGVFDNYPRVLPKNTDVVLEKRAFRPQPVFDLIAREGRISEEEMYGVFNMGVGLALVVKKTGFDRVMEYLSTRRAGARPIGEIVGGRGHVRLV